MEDQTQNQKEALKIGICDDEPVMLEHLRELTYQILADRWNLEVECFPSYAQMRAAAKAYQILILDIQLEDGNGIELAKQVGGENPECQILFVSGFVQYVSDVYDVPHVCLVLKDQLQAQLPRFLIRAAEKISSQDQHTIEIRVKGSSLRLHTDQIRLMEQNGHVTYIYLANGNQLQTRGKLKELAKHPDFLQCHVSYAVNLNWVEALQEKDFRLRSGESIPISRANYRRTKEAFFRTLVERTEIS